jgi:hypothetical protein
MPKRTIKYKFKIGLLTYSAAPNYYHLKWDYDNPILEGKWDDSEIGLNLGIGANLDQFFGELK